MLWMVRFLNDDGSPCGNYSIVQAHNKRELFWLIDEHGDPRSCEIASLNNSFTLNFSAEYEFVKPYPKNMRDYDNGVEIKDIEFGFDLWSFVSCCVDGGFNNRFHDPDFPTIDKLLLNKEGDAYALLG